MAPIESKRTKVLEAALKIAVFEGWNSAMLARAVQDAGLDVRETERLFPKGVSGLLEFFNSESDRKMVDAAKQLDLPKMKVHKRIMTLVMTRLTQNLPHREAIRRGVAFYALPMNALDALRVLYKTLDEIWYQAGDTSTDFNFYTKRALLAPVFTSTVMFWLDDKSEGQKETATFLERRIMDVLKIQTFRKHAEEAVSEFVKSPMAFLKRK